LGVLRTTSTRPPLVSFLINSALLSPQGWAEEWWVWLRLPASTSLKVSRSSNPPSSPVRPEAPFSLNSKKKGFPAFSGFSPPPWHDKIVVLLPPLAHCADHQLPYHLDSGLSCISNEPVGVHFSKLRSIPFSLLFYPPISVLNLPFSAPSSKPPFFPPVFVRVNSRPSLRSS